MAVRVRFVGHRVLLLHSWLGSLSPPRPVVGGGVTVLGHLGSSPRSKCRDGALLHRVMTSYLPGLEPADLIIRFPVCLGGFVSAVPTELPVTLRAERIDKVAVLTLDRPA